LFGVRFGDRRIRSDLGSDTVRRQLRNRIKKLEAKMKSPFVNPRTGAVHFPADEEQPDGADNPVHRSPDLANSAQPVTRGDFIESTPLRQLELIANELEKLRGWSAEREMELERALGEIYKNPHRKLLPMQVALADAFSQSANELEGVAQKIRYAISECYSAWGRQSDE
jgi:hypothetical protein